MRSRGFVAVSPTTQKRFTLLWAALFILSLLLQYTQAATPAGVLAASGLKAGTVQGFEVDGDLKSGDASGNPGAIPAGLIDGTLTNGDDWLDGASGNGVVDPEIPGSSTLINDPIDATSDDGFGGGAKEDDTRTWSYVAHKPTPKDDVRHAMAYAKFVGSSAFFYAGAERIVNNGDTHIDFELNRKPFKTWSDGISKPDRSVGDVLVSLEFSNGGSDPIVTVYKVTAVVDHPSGQETTFSADIATAAAVHSATNFVDLPSAGFGYTIPSFEFAETSIDLSALGINTSCPGLSNGHIRTRSGGDIDSSQLKDNIQPFPIDLNNCGKLRIEKHAGTTDGPLVGGAEFDITPNPVPGGGGTLHVVDNGANDSDPTAGEIEIDPAVPGDYEVCETDAPAGYNLPADPCKNVTVPPNGTATVKFADPRKVAATVLTVVTGPPATVYAGNPIHIVVNEENAGESVLTDVHVSGTNSCSSWDPVGAFGGTLVPGEDQDFECTFDAPSDDFGWSATGHGTDELGDPAPGTNETVSGDVEVLNPATELTIKTDAPARVYPGDSVHIVVTEENTGDTNLTDVSVTGSNSCASWDPVGAFDGTLAPNESQDFECTFDAPGDDFSWSATGNGTDSNGNPVPIDNETVSGDVEVLNPATELAIETDAPAKVYGGTSVHIVVTETNSGDSDLSGVNVTGTGSCASWDPVGAFDGTLAPNESQDFECTFSAPTDDFSWSATGHGTDELRNPAPLDNEQVFGDVEVLNPATELTIVGQVPAKVYPGDSIHIVVHEENAGDSDLTGVFVDGTGSCATWDPVGAFDGNLAPGEGHDFECTFSAPSDDFSWSATGHGTDELQNPAPPDNETVGSDIEVIRPATTLTLVSEDPDPVLVGGTATITVRETNAGDDVLSGLNVTGSPCANWTPVDGGFSGTLAVGAHEDFICTATNVGPADVAWSAVGHGTDSLGNPVPLDNEDEQGSIHVVNPNIDLVKTVGASLGSQTPNTETYFTLDGSTVVYKYVVTTMDPDGLTNVTVSDDLCSPVIAVTSGGHNVGDSNGNDTLEPGESWIFSCTDTLTIAGDGSNVHNTGTATGTPALGNDVSDTDDALVVLRHPAATIAKDENDADNNVFPGQDVTYTLTITVSGGPTDLTVTDELSSGYHFVSASDGGTLSGADASGNGGTITWNLTNVADGQHTVSYVVTVVATSGTLPNVATVCVPPFNDFQEACEQADHEVKVPAISITKSHNDADGVVLAGQVVTYTIEVAVTDGPLANAVISDPLPAGQSYVIGSQTSNPAADSFDSLSHTLTWTYASLDGTATFTYQVTINADASGALPNTATFCADADEDRLCADAGATVTVRVPALQIEKSVVNNTVDRGTVEIDGKTAVKARVGDTLVYTLAYTVTNGPVTNAFIDDVFPVGLGTPTNISNGGTYNAVTHTIHWSLGTLNDGTYTQTYEVVVIAGADELPQPFNNVATADSDETAPDSDDALVAVEPIPLSLTLPPTDTLGETGQGGTGNGLLMVLVVLAGVVTALGFLTPAPARVRRGKRRRERP